MVEAKHTTPVTAIEATTGSARTNIEADYTAKLAELLNIETTTSDKIAALIAKGEHVEAAHQSPLESLNRLESDLLTSEITKDRGYLDPPKGYHRARHGDDLILMRNPGMADSLPRLEYDPASGKFVDVGAAKAVDMARSLSKVGASHRKEQNWLSN